MCKHEIVLTDGTRFLSHDIPICGQCANTNWCPIYLSGVKVMLEKFQAAREPLKMAHKELKEASSYRRRYVIKGAIHVLEHADEKVEPIIKKMVKSLLLKS